MQLKLCMPRPLEHNREKVIAAAMQVFWDKGYSATSMADLKAATGLNSGSIYSSYQSKEDLFLETLTVYCNRSIENQKNSLFASADYIQNIYAFFEKFEEKSATEKESQKGCFFVNTLVEVSPHNPKVKELLTHYTDSYQQNFMEALTQAKHEKQIDELSNIKLMAQQLMLLIWGLRVMHKSSLLTDSTTVVSQQLDDMFKASE